MNTTLNTRQKYILGSQVAAVLVVAAGLKLFYSMTGVNELRWILAPTAVLVEFATGIKFTFESNAGYMSGDNSFLIAASCSGVNFLIAAFLMLTLRWSWRDRAKPSAWFVIPFAAIAAYITTILANTVRISTALAIRHFDPDIVWLNPEQLHRFEGILVYFGFLLLLYFVSEKVGADDLSTARRDTGVLRRFAFPLAVYYAVTLGIPLANGAFVQGLEFWKHSAFVILIPIVLILPFTALRPRRTGG